MSVAALLSNYSADSHDIQLLYKGYTADTYSFVTQDGRFIAKHINVKSGTILEDGLDSAEIFKRETESIARLVQHNTKAVFVPEICYKDPNNLLYIQKYYAFEKFNSLIRQLGDNQEQIARLEHLGEFLAAFHAANIIAKDDAVPHCYLHGDLNNKNIGITADGRLIIIDPGFRNREIMNSVYFDIARVLLNFFPYDLWLSSKVTRKVRFSGAKAFLDSYKNHAPFAISPSDSVGYAIDRNTFSRTNYASRTNYLKNISMFLLGARIHRELVDFREYVTL